MGRELQAAGVALGGFVVVFVVVVFVGNLLAGLIVVLAALGAGAAAAVAGYNYVLDRPRWQRPFR